VPAAQGAFGSGLGATTGGFGGSTRGAFGGAVPATGFGVASFGATAASPFVAAAVAVQVASLSSGVVCEYAVADLQFADGSSLATAPPGPKFTCFTRI
jgi:hypothetical protein